MLINKKITITFLVFITCLFNSFGQNYFSEIEKEYLNIKKSHPDYYLIVGKYAQALLVNDRASQSFAILDENIKYVLKTKDHKNIAYLYSIKAIEYFVINDKANAVETYKCAQKYAEKCNDFKIKGTISYTGGWLAIRMETEIEALKHFFMALENYNKVKDQESVIKNKAVIYNELSQIFGKLRDYENQKKYSEKNMEFALKQNDPNVIFTSYMTLGYVNLQLLNDNPDNTDYFKASELNFLKALTIYESNHLIYEQDYAYVCLNLATLYLRFTKDKDINKVRKYVLIVEDISLRKKAHVHLASAYQFYGEIEYYCKNYAKAKKHFLDAINTMDKSIKVDEIIQLAIYHNLYITEEKLGNYKEAYYYLQKYHDLYDYLNNTNKVFLTKRIEAEYQSQLQHKEYEKLQLISEKKEQQIKLLNLNNLQKEYQLNNLRLIKENQEKKLKLNQFEGFKKFQELQLSKLENDAKTQELITYKHKLLYKEEVNRNYFLIIISIILMLLLVLFILRQRTLKMRQKVINYKMALEKEKQNAKISSLTSLLEGQERERSRLAKDLHDGLGGVLAAIKLQMSEFISKSHNEDNSELINISEHINYAMNKMRKISHNVMPEMLTRFGLETTLKDFAKRVETENLRIHIEFLNYTNSLHKDKELFVYRIIQELVNNAIKHAEASFIMIQLIEEDDKYLVTVEDDGVGFNTENLDFSHSAGYFNIKSRINFLKGEYQIFSEKDKGTSFEFSFPK